MSRIKIWSVKLTQRCVFQLPMHIKLKSVTSKRHIYNIYAHFMICIRSDDRRTQKHRHGNQWLSQNPTINSLLIIIQLWHSHSYFWMHLVNHSWYNKAESHILKPFANKGNFVFCIYGIPTEPLAYTLDLFKGRN